MEQGQRRRRSAPRGGNLGRRRLETGKFDEIGLDRIKPSDIEALVLAMPAKTKSAKVAGADPVRALSDATIRQVYTVLRAGLGSSKESSHK